PDTLEDLIGQREVNPHQGQAAGARLDVPDIGGIAVNTFSPGITATALYTNSIAGWWFDNDTTGEPWDTRGYLSGQKLKEQMADYRRTLTLICHTDDRPHRDNGVGTDVATEDEHGPG